VTFIILQEAQDEADHGPAWYDARVAGLGDEFYDELDNVFRFIRNHPRDGAPIRLRGTSSEVRRRNVKRFAYKVIYQVIPTGVMIVSVMHAKRRPNYWRRRLIP
jgi:toxin ParE1/3/4